MHPEAHSGESACLRRCGLSFRSSMCMFHGWVQLFDRTTTVQPAALSRYARRMWAHAICSPSQLNVIMHVSRVISASSSTTPGPGLSSVSSGPSRVRCAVVRGPFRPVHDTPKRELTGPETLQMPSPCHQPASSTATVSLHISSPYIWWAADPGTYHSCLPPAAILHSRLFQDLLESFSGSCGAAERKQPAASESSGSDCCAHCCPIFSTAAAAHDVSKGARGVCATAPPATHQCLSTAGGSSCVAAPPAAHVTIALPVPADAFAAWLAFVCANPADAEPAAAAAAAGTAGACCPAPARLRLPRLLSTPALQAVLAVADVVNDAHTVQAAARMLGAALFLSPAPPPAADVEVRRLVCASCCGTVVIIYRSRMEHA